MNASTRKIVAFSIYDREFVKELNHDIEFGGNHVHVFRTRDNELGWTRYFPSIEEWQVCFIK